MKLLALILLLPLAVAADEAEDHEADARAQIQQVLARLNADPFDPSLFTARFEDRAEVVRLFGGSVPTVTISHEPWGEASLNLAGPSPRLIFSEIRVLTSDIAVAEGVLLGIGAPFGAPQRSAIVVLRKQQDHWRIRSIHSSVGTPP